MNQFQMDCNRGIVNAKEYCHDRLADTFAELISNYDVHRRMETLIDRFLTDDQIKGKKALDIGCGLGFFSQRLKERGAVVTACDLGPTLVKKTLERVGCESVVGDVLRCSEQFGKNSFDLVVSSECIEHTSSPDKALREMAAVLRPGGFMAVSTPNTLWYPVIALATKLRARPYDALENFSTFFGIRKVLAESGVEVLQEYGLHLFPFQFGMHGLSRWCDRNLQGLRRLMINLCILGQKTATTPHLPWGDPSP